MKLYFTNLLKLTLLYIYLSVRWTVMENLPQIGFEIIVETLIKKSN